MNPKPEPKQKNRDDRQTAGMTGNSTGAGYLFPELGANLPADLSAGPDADALAEDATESETAPQLKSVPQADSPASHAGNRPLPQPHEATPAMRQYLEIKKKYPDTILFFRMGDFYEMFYDDAKIASAELNIALTSRDRNSPNPVPMCGVPHHSSNSYLARLVNAGYKVAVCEQMEDPKFAKGVVKRDIVRIVTPGTVTQEEMLAEKTNNWLCALSFIEDRRGLTVGAAFADITTGEFHAAEFDCANPGGLGRLAAEFARYNPRETIVPLKSAESPAAAAVIRRLRDEARTCVNGYDDWQARPDYAGKTVTESIGVNSISSFGLENRPAAVGACGAAIAYLKETQKCAVAHIRAITVKNFGDTMTLDPATRRTLELTRPAEHAGGQVAAGKPLSLFSLLDDCATAMGSRLLARRIEEPLIRPEPVQDRLDSVESFYKLDADRGKVTGLLPGVGDIERIAGRIALKSASPRDLAALRAASGLLPQIGTALIPFTGGRMTAIKRDWENLEQVKSLLESAIADDPPAMLKDGGVIRQGYNSELDDLRLISRETKTVIARLEQQERARTGIATLKIKYNKIYGYYIEVGKKHAGVIPEGYIRKQSLVNAERFVSPELKEYEEKILGADERIALLESALYTAVLDSLAGHIPRIQHAGLLVAEVDVTAALARQAKRYGYVKPEIHAEPGITVTGGRHPVVERIESSGGFVPNDIDINTAENRVLVITGPNMAGKSTYLRMTALIVIMAQIGSYVPAQSARIGVVDRVFTRVGAQDYLQRGQSTFMVEMTELANILNNATARSLILLDEIGRGTSTFDGISIAWAAVEHIHDTAKLGAMTMFATHYHELTELSATLPGVTNMNVAVREWNDEIIFLRKIVPGGADKSYGIQVARLAGLPHELLGRAKEILGFLESNELDEFGMPKLKAPGGISTGILEKSIFADSATPDPRIEAINEIEALEIDKMTPLDALAALDRIRKKLRAIAP